MRVLLLAAALKLSAADIDVLVDIPGLGSVEGIHSRADYPGSGVFVNIPFAVPPVGAMRWKPPVESQKWEGTLNATAPGPKCMQDSVGAIDEDRPMSEDCLSLNIVTPLSALSSSKKLPVMVFIHGGSYTSGFGGACTSDDTQACWASDALVAASNTSIVVVSMNYRLNVFGFLGSKELTGTDAQGTTGNYGIQDQRLALAWTKKHIGAFGGDGDDIAIFGESAGGNSVINHLSQKASFSFYQKAIVESGAYSRGAKTISFAQDQFQTLVNVSGCDADEDVSVLGCLMAVDAEKLLVLAVEEFTTISQTCGTSWCPTVDQVELDDFPLDLVDAGDYNTNVPVIAGSNRDEWAFFALIPPGTDLVPENMTEAQFDALFEASWELSASEVAELKSQYDPTVYTYPATLGAYSQWWWSTMRVITDAVPGLGACGVRSFSQMLSDGGSPSVYNYMLTHPTQAMNQSEAVTGIPGLIGNGTLFVPHAAELVYVFGDSSGLDAGEEADLARSMASYWSAFANSGVPSVAGLPEFPKWSPENDSILVLDVASAGCIRAQAHIRKAACDYSDLHPNRPA